jgi:hypothetical protein
MSNTIQKQELVKEPCEITKIIAEYRETHTQHQTTAFINGMIAYNKMIRL